MIRHSSSDRNNGAQEKTKCRRSVIRSEEEKVERLSLSLTKHGDTNLRMRCLT